MHGTNRSIVVLALFSMALFSGTHASPTDDAPAPRKGSLCVPAPRGEDLRLVKDLNWRRELHKWLVSVVGGTGLEEHPLPWYLWGIGNHEQDVESVLLEIEDGYRIPGDCTAYVHAFDSGCQYVYGSAFSVGWRSFACSADFEKDHSLGIPLVTIRTTPLIASQRPIDCSDPSHEILLAVLPTRVALIGFSDSLGRPLRNHYSSPNLAIGPPVPVRTQEEWIEILSHGDGPFFREALVWLGGIHLDPSQPEPWWCHESLEDARLVATLRGDPIIHGILERLVGSSESELREAATLILNPEYPQVLH